MERVETTAKLTKLRTLMRERNVDVYIIPSEDSHSSEYIAPGDARREYISGFSGSAGCAVVTLDQAALATDGRYFAQASQQLDDNWTLLKQGIQDVPTWQEWSTEQAAGGKVVAVDPKLVSSSTAKKLSDKIQKNGGAELVALDENLVDLVWSAEQPPRPSQPIIRLAEEFCGKDVASKLAELRKELEKKNAAAFVVSMLDEVAWLFNMRGSDIPYNPVFFSYAVITSDAATLFLDSDSLTPECKAYLGENGVVVRPYEDIFTEASEVGKRVSGENTESPAGAKKSILVSTRASWALQIALGGPEIVEEVRSPVGDAKAIKNDAELEGMRACHIRDGAALIEYFAWLESQLLEGDARLSEADAAAELERIRSKMKNHIGPSFDTISSTGPNGAIIHYKPEPGNCAIIKPDAVYLCDSGAQYLDGTTDTTRTIHFGTPTDEERHAYTLVLKGNIALDMAIFPKGTTGFALDCLARQHLWREGLDYRHGTGHGVGSFLNVHEGPIGIGTRVQYAEVALAPGNCVSIEPGYYEDGAFGIRIENIALVRQVGTRHTFGGKPYLGFEHVTMVPYCRKLIDESLLTPAEVTWLNEYHEDILEKTRPFLEGKDRALAWLERETKMF